MTTVGTKAPSPILKRVSYFVRFLLLGAMLSAAARAQSDYATPYYFSTFAGVNSIGDADGSGADARFFHPAGGAVDSSGNIYVSDFSNHTVRKISPSGAVTTLAGLAGFQGNTDGTGSAARFRSPCGLAVDASGNVFVADSGNSTIRKITPAGVVTTFAGLAGEKGTTDGTGGSARFQNPLGLTMTIDGNLYVADDSGDLFVAYFKREARESLIRKITPAGVVTTFAAGLNKNTYNSSGTSTIRPFQAITSDANGNVLVASTTNITQNESNLITVDQNIIKYAPDGSSTTLIAIAAHNSRVPPGVYPFPAGESGFITDLSIDQSGRLLVAEYYQISRFDLTGASNPVETVLISGNANVPGLTGNPPYLGYDIHLAADHSNNILIIDTDENVVRRMSPNLAIATVAGLSFSEAARSLDGTGSAARFHYPYGLCTDVAGNLYAADPEDNVIRKISQDGTVTTLAGLAGTSGNSNGTGSVAHFLRPCGIATDRLGQIYVADTQNKMIRKISPSGEVSNFAGSGDFGFQDGPASAATFYAPTDLTIDSSGNLYVIDSDCIRKISPSGDVSTLAGAQTQYGATDGAGSEARFNNPRGLAADALGNIYVADSGNAAIRKISSLGNVTTLTGGAMMAGSADGKLADAGFYYPTDLAFDTKGDLFVVDSSNHTLRKITPDGDVSTVAGLAGVDTNADGLGDKALFNSPYQLTIDPQGNLFVGNSQAILKGQLAGPPVITTQPASQTVTTGNSVQFSVTAGGVPAPTYQWYFNGGAFSGATDSTLSFPNARSTDAGDYTVVITNDLGSVTSAKATLTISDGSMTGSSSPSTGGSGGGGAFEAWFALMLLALGAACGLAGRGFSRR